MSQRAINLAVKAFLQDKFDLDASSIDETPQGMPAPTAGEQFIGICEAPVKSNAYESSDQVFGVNIVITRKLGVAPHDRIGDEVVNKMKDGLRFVAQQVHAALHADGVQYSILADANAEIIEEANEQGASPTQRVYGFSEPLRVGPMSVPQPRGPKWFHADGESQEAGYSITISLVGARRLQPKDAPF